MAGNKKARVFPEPVDEMPIISRPAKAMGQPCDWIGDAVYMYMYMYKRDMYTYMREMTR